MTRANPQDAAAMQIEALADLSAADFTNRVTHWVYSKTTPGSKAEQHWTLRLLSDDPRLPPRVRMLMRIASAYKAIESTDFALIQESFRYLDLVIENSWALPMSESVPRENGVALRFSSLRALIHLHLAADDVPQALEVGRRAVEDFNALDASRIRQPWFGEAMLGPAYCGAIGLLEAIYTESDTRFQEAWGVIRRAMIEGFCIGSSNPVVAQEYLEAARVYNFSQDLDLRLRTLRVPPSLEAFIPSQLTGLMRLSLRKEDPLVTEMLVDTWRRFLASRGVPVDV